jgi:glycosyltransferase involved in cell wall biosynthesis
MTYQAMQKTPMQKPLTIFVSRASECLTDHESHGEGLICFSLLKGLAERGHRIYAYTSQAAIRQMPSGLMVQAEHHRVPANSLAPWEHAYRSRRCLGQLMQTEKVDLIWHMNPCGSLGCPKPPQTFGLPLVVGPLYYDWPKTPIGKNSQGRPRLGFGLQPWLEPIAKRGWQQTLTRSTALFCATEPHAAIMQQRLPWVQVSALPLIVEPPLGALPKASRSDSRVWTLAFAGNFVPDKNPKLFCETIYRLREAGIAAHGVLLGDGPERTSLEAYTKQKALQSTVCFRGKVPNGAIYEHLHEADFLVSTSLGEPYGRGIAEAMSVGTPAICHRSGGPADFIADGKNGLLVDTLTASAFAERLQQVFSGSSYDSLSQNARCTAEQWTSNAVLSHLESVLRKASR